MKSGKFARYNGKEYEYYRNMDKTITIISRDSDDISLGFSKCHDVYVKCLNIYEVEELYSVYTYGIYKGQIVGIRTEENEKYNIEVSGSEDIFLRLGFEIIERGVYRKWIKKSEVERIWEEKILH
jgi:hypothetical protein